MAKTCRNKSYRLLYYFQPNEISWTRGTSGANSRQEQQGWKISAMRVPCAWDCTNPSPKPAELSDALWPDSMARQTGGQSSESCSPAGAWMELQQWGRSSSLKEAAWSLQLLLHSIGTPQCPMPLPTPSPLHGRPCSPSWHEEH